MFSLTKVSSILIVFFCISTVNCRELLPYEAPEDSDLSLRAGEREDSTTTIKPPERKTCKKPGLLCATCQELVICLELPDGTFYEDSVETCTGINTCSESVGKCSSDPNPDCVPEIPNYKFTCVQYGIFPDPLTCNKYHMCIPDKATNIVQKDPITFRCPTGFAYNALTTLCDVKIETKGCKLHFPPCNNTAGQKGALRANPSMYYMCTKNGALYLPKLYVCPNNFKYNGNTCEDISSPKATNANGLCIAKRFFEDPDNCLSYLECQDTGKTPIKRSCGSNRFSFKDQKCIPFTCLGY